MKNLKQKIQENSWSISLFLLSLIMIQTCNLSKSLRIQRKESNAQAINFNMQLDSMSISFKKELKIESLKAEKRMIQSTDRKMLDVTRQSEIDKEIEILSKKN
jgi:hypothetical protein